eukprot:gb/GFBE01073788.1/.p1 GENE.gb/GFBE01073788.1/~~gb/GFBE01073788.1/.p1  ORF type:complete len:151 (+),score=31.89 gb/GFBE01073788.1/:1-453(+)
MACVRSALMALLAAPALAAHCTYPHGECFELRLQKCRGSDQWTIHGLWAEWNNGCSGPEFDESQISSIEDQLKQSWPSCYGESTAEFWGHEWSKHGTCSGLSEAAYFQKALDLKDKYVDSCNGDKGDCSICFSKDFSTQETCPSGTALLV